MKILKLIVLACVGVGVATGYEYHVGVGIADITGPAAEVGMVRF